MDSRTRSEWLRSLLVAHEARLLRYARRWLTEESSREVVQESFMRLWKEDANDLQGRETEWLFCVVRNLAIDVAKKESRVNKKFASGSQDGVDILDQLPSPARSPDDALVEVQQESAVLRSLASLTESQQEVMRLKFQEGFSYKEISSITGHSVSNVGVLIHEAMKKVRHELKF